MQTFVPTLPKPLKVLSVTSFLLFEGYLGYMHSTLQNQTAYISYKSDKIETMKRQHETLTTIKLNRFSLMLNYIQIMSWKSIWCEKHIPCKAHFTLKWNTFNFDPWVTIKASVQQRLQTMVNHTVSYDLLILNQPFLGVILTTCWSLSSGP